MSSLNRSMIRKAIVAAVVLATAGAVMQPLLAAGSSRELGTASATSDSTTQPILLITERGDLTTTTVPTISALLSLRESVIHARGERVGNPIVRIADGTGTVIHTGRAQEALPYIRVGYRYVMSLDGSDDKPGVQQPFTCDGTICVVAIASNPKQAKQAEQAANPDSIARAKKRALYLRSINW